MLESTLRPNNIYREGADEGRAWMNTNHLKTALLCCAMVGVTLSAVTPSCATAAPGKSDLVLVCDGRSDYVIVVPDAPIPSVAYAARELASFVEQITGVLLPIITDKKPPGPYEILLGANNTHIADLGFRLPTDPWVDDGFSVVTSGSTLVLAGDEPRGTLYAVYEFLEQQGVRFLAPDVTRVPKLKLLAVEPLREVHRPAFRGRGHMLHCVQQSDNDWAVRLRYNSPWFGRWSEERGGNLRYGFGPHSFFHIIPPATYFNDHPDWFSEINGERISTGQLCLTNPALLKEVTSVLLERMRKWPQMRFWDVSQMDGSPYCQCSDCAALAKAEGSQSGPIIHFVNAVAENIEREFPQNLITTFAYSYGVDAPKTVKARHNVAIRLCPIDKDWVRPIDAESPVEVNRLWAQRFEDWSRHAQHLLVWDYGTNFADYMDIFPDYGIWKPNFLFYLAHGVKIVDMQGSYTEPYGELCYPRAYVIGKLLWDPSRDERALIQEYLDGVYGPHAKLVKSILDFCKTTALASHPDSAMTANGWAFNKGGFDYDALDGWRNKVETALASEDDPVRQRHLKLLLIPICKVLVETGKPRLIKTATGLEPDREVSDSYRSAVDRLFELGREFHIAGYREAAGDFQTLETEIRGQMKKQPYLHLESDSLSLRILPGRGGVITAAHVHPHKTTRMQKYETYVGHKWHDPGWCEFYRIDETSPDMVRMTADLSGQMEIERTFKLTGTRTFSVTDKLTNRGPEQIRLPLYSNLIFSLRDREEESVYILQPDGSWTPGRFPNGHYEHMFPLGYAKGGGWALINKLTRKGVAVYFKPEDIAQMDFWSINEFSLQLRTHTVPLDKDASTQRTFRIEFLEQEQSGAIIEGGPSGDTK